MMKYTRKILALILAAVLMLSACSASPSSYGSVVAATYGDKTLYLDEANFWLRYEQMGYSTTVYLYQYSGIDFWSQPSNRRSQNFGESIKEDVMATFLQIFVLLDHEGEYNTTLTEEDKAKIDKTITNLKENYKDSLFQEYITGNYSDDKLRASLEMRARALKVWDGVRQQAPLSVTDAEADSFTVNYFQVPADSGITTEGSTELKGEEMAVFLGNQLLSGESFDTIKSTFEGLTASTVSYRWADTDSATKAPYRLGSVLSDGQVTWQEDNGYWYVVQCVSAHDPEATAAARTSLEDAQKDAYFQEIYAAWAKEAKKFDVKAAYNNLPLLLDAN